MSSYFIQSYLNLFCCDEAVLFVLSSIEKNHFLTVPEKLFKVHFYSISCCYASTVLVKIVSQSVHCEIARFIFCLSGSFYFMQHATSTLLKDYG